MKEIEHNNLFNTDEINLKMIFMFFWNQKLVISIFSFFSIIISLLYALYLPNIYKSTAVLVPTSVEENLSSQMSSFSTVASFAGINLSSGEATKSQEAILRIKSFDFFSKYFLPEIKLENLIAIKKWSPKENIITYDEDLFLVQNNEWIRDVSYPKTKVPSKQESYLVYRDILNISIDESTSSVTISITNNSPYVAKSWLELIIKGINQSMRNEDREIALNSIEYLKQYGENTNLQSLKLSVANLMESQLHTLMLASSTDDYIFSVIDPPLAPELRSEPNRVMIIIAGSMFGFLFSIFIVFAYAYFKNENQ